MIALRAAGRKSPKSGRESPVRRRIQRIRGFGPAPDHAFVKSIIIRPYFGQSPAQLGCDTGIVASWPGALLSAGFLSPPAPRGSELPGQFRVRFNPQTSPRAGQSPARFFSRGDRRPGVAVDAASGARRRCAGWVAKPERRTPPPARQDRLRSSGIQCSGMMAAPSTRPGLPPGCSCTMTATSSMPGLSSDSGTRHDADLPVHSPSLCQPRTTLW